eukprot:Sspe_Gene.60725::Locus_33525_Transcript_1_1_Confidence_1.000_Length_3429::g.60725::m.60725/K10588/UBE3B; ubiquitin-protein ligase E3 B
MFALAANTKVKPSAAASAQREREQRQKRRAAEKAARQIQRCFRTFQAIRKTSEDLLGQFDAEYALFFPDTATRNALKLRPTVAPVPDGRVVLSLLQRLLQALIPRKRLPPSLAPRVMDMVRLLTASIARPNSSSFCYLSIDHKMGTPWQYAVVRLLDLCEWAMQRSATQVPFDRVGFGVVSKLLIDLLEARNWAFLRHEKDNRAAMAKQAIDVTDQIALRLARSSYFRMMQSVLTNSTSETSPKEDVLVTVSVALCVRIASVSKAACRCLEETVLCIPSLLTRTCSPRLADLRLWSTLLPIEKGWGHSPFLVGNIIEIGKSAVEKHSDLAPRWAKAVADLMATIPTRADVRRVLEQNDCVERQLCMLWHPSTLKTVFPGLLDEPDSHDLTRTASRSLFAHLRGTSVSSEPPFVMAVAAIAVAVIRAAECPFQLPSLDTWEPPPWTAACRLFNSLIYSWDPRAAVTALMGHPCLMQSLWSYLSTHRAILERAVEEGGQEDTPLLEILQLFIHCYDNYLQVCDDKEFFQLQQPFRLSTVAYMVELFTKLAFRLAWEEEEKGGGREVKKNRLIMSTRSTLMKLHIKNVRREFCEPAVWHIDEFKKARGFDFADVLKYLEENSQNNPFESLFGVLGNISQEMAQSDDPLDRHFGFIFGDLRDMVGDHIPPRSSTITHDDQLKRYQAVLHPMPFLVPFRERLDYLRHLIERDRKAHHARDVKYVVTVARDTLLVDAFKEFARLDKIGCRHLKSQLHLRFKNHEGLVEEGIDGGGLFKEFVETVIKQGFNPDLGLFTPSPSGALYPNPASKTAFTALPYDHIAMFRFLGRVLAKAIYEGVVVDMPFTDFFLNTMLGLPNSVEDLEGLDRELHRNLIALKDIDDLSPLCITFSVQDGENVVPLIPGGANIPVVADNLSLYLNLVAAYKLKQQFREQAAAFAQGFHEILPHRMLALFNRCELQQLISGLDGTFDLLELRKHTKYEGYHDNHPVIENFWNVVEQFDHTEKGQFLMFVTASSRPPLLGFGYLTPPFQIRYSSIHDGPLTHTTEDIDYLPSASTCFNLLQLPPYRSIATLDQKLRYAITSNTGFELS